MFLGRTRELDVLAELAASPRPELFVLYGRRRVGKTELLQQFCRGRRAVYFLAAQVREKDNLRAFRDALVEGLNDPLAANVDFPDWGAALSFAAERAREERLVLVLDEFPYLCEATKGLPSIVQRFWDTRAKASQLMLVLCGSQVSFMESEVLAETSPLFGRRTGQRRLEPLRPPDALRFFDAWPLRERVLGYAILGGMPAYLRRFDPARSLRENCWREVLRPEGYLFDEVNFLLRAELTSPATYNSILAAVARGAEKLGDVALTVGVDSPTANKYLTTLRELQLVEREVPLTDPDPLRSRRGTYRVADRFLAFHFRHVQPNAALIQSGRGQAVWERAVEPDLPRLHADALVDCAIDHLRTSSAELVGDEVVDTARNSGALVRAVARTSSGLGVAAALVPHGSLGLPGLAAELAALKPALGSRLITLVYRVAERGDEPLLVERLPEGVLK
ncbi:MAG: ATP-binding protein [Planctomycetes bacterium]|nr:ATP-binding protein [Planctomycetota bacterium]